MRPVRLLLTRLVQGLPVEGREEWNLVLDVGNWGGCRTITPSWEFRVGQEACPHVEPPWLPPGNTPPYVDCAYIAADGTGKSKLVSQRHPGSVHQLHSLTRLILIGTCRWKEGEGYSGTFGFIDHSSHFVINPQYDYADDFKNGFAKVDVGNGNDRKAGYIDKTGKIIWQPSN